MQNVLTYIDSLKEEPVSNDLEEASRNYADSEEYGDDVYFAIKAAFKAGANWQKEKDEEEKVLTYKHGFEDCKEQMMAKAIDAKLLEGHLIRQKGATHPLHVGDKVKVIVIEED